MRILIAASGSGGHLFPALHIARALKTAKPQVKIEFIGAGRPLEHKLVAPLYPLHEIAAARVMQHGLGGIVRFMLTLPRALKQLSSLFAQQRPAAVIGVGGYASVIPVGYAALRGIPTLIHEAEKSPGLANRVLAPFVKVVSVARAECVIPGTRERLAAGQPMRAGLASITSAREVPRSILVMGGSQGAAALDLAAGVIGKIAAKFQLSVTHQTRPDNVEQVVRSYQDCHVSAEVVGFLSDMNAAYEKSDLIISRAGASTVSEIEVTGRPVIFVPYPHAQGDHQSENAGALSACGRAVICAEGERFEERLEGVLRSVLGENAPDADAHEHSQRITYRSMRREPASTPNERSAAVIAQRILALAGLG